jgi:hypothetical protein
MKRDKGWQHWTAVILLCVIFIVPVVLGVYWLIWQFYMWVIAGLWPTAPIAVREPGYWYFVGALLLIFWVTGRFGKR